jgi:hypothetical protein
MSSNGTPQTLHSGSESRQGGASPFVVSTVCRVPRKTATRETVDFRPVVVENARFVWVNQTSTVLSQLHPDLVFDYSEQLGEAAINRLPPLLVEVWAEHGFQVRFGAYDEVFGQLRGIDRKTYWAVTDEACSRLDVDQLVRDADLVDLQRSLYTD